MDTPQTLGDVLADIDRRLADAASYRSNPMHVPVVGTADGDMRIMVLRAYDPQTRTCRFHTDARAPKVRAIDADPAMALLFYDKKEKVQIRCRGNGRIERTGPVADAAWEESSNFAKRCYLAPLAPSAQAAEPTSNLPDDLEGVEPDAARVAEGRENFAVLLVELTHIDWFHLAHTGHRRAALAAPDFTGSWIAP
ncbi:PNPOx family protein [Sphingomicrobium marinum]|uniref:pyridoxamine 5'-phosphate oxidase family protein n=1 Tax=Sphingomicrobium marinum TaxID=1227950 RepID=UPI00223F0DF6|nr:pyridoxamine 5'-phosphate oxidase family protein [Sphingomicrobium marinum]